MKIKSYFQVLADKGMPNIRFELSAIKELIHPNFTGELCLFLLPIEKYKALRSLVSAAKAWKQTQNNLEEKPAFGFTNIGKKHNQALWEAVSEVEKNLPW